jgi:hypothetical protein
MKKIVLFKKVGLLWLPLIALLFSCASTAPETQTPPPQAAQEAAPPPAAPQPGDERAARERAVEAMNRAKSVKADVAVKDVYNRALGRFNEAESLAGSPAAGAYGEAAREFLAAYDQAIVLREEALRQLELAKTAIKDVEDEAAGFDREQQDGDQGGAQ